MHRIIYDHNARPSQTDRQTNITASRIAHRALKNCYYYYYYYYYNKCQDLSDAITTVAGALYKVYQTRLLSQ